MLTKSESGKYRLKFMPEALEEWNALDGGAKGLLRKALKKRLEQPHVGKRKKHGGVCVRNSAVTLWGVMFISKIWLKILDKFWTLSLCFGVFEGAWAFTKNIKKQIVVI